MTDAAIQRYARESARSAQFPLGLKGQRVRFRASRWSTSNNLVTTETIGQVVECHPCFEKPYNWRFLLLLDSGEIVQITLTTGDQLFLAD